MEKREYIEPLIDSVEVILEQGIAASVNIYDDWGGGVTGYDADGNPT